MKYILITFLFFASLNVKAQDLVSVNVKASLISMIDEKSGWAVDELPYRFLQMESDVPAIADVAVIAPLSSYVYYKKDGVIHYRGVDGVEYKYSNIDTVTVATLTLQAQDWAYLVGSWNTQVDSVSMVAYRNIRDAVQATQNPTWTTNITVNNIPGSVVLAFYQIVKTSGAGEIVARYTTITNALNAKTEIAYWRGLVDANLANDYLRKRDRGKNLLID